MQVQSKLNQGGKPRSTRKNTFKRKNRAGENGGSKSRFDDSTIGAAGFHLLTKDLKPLTLLEIAINSNDDKAEGFLSMIQTEEQQLQMIDDLYKVVKAQPKYKKLKERIWSAETSPITVIIWLLKKLGPLAKGNYWTVDSFTEGKKTRYCFVVTKNFRSDLVKSDEEYFPMDFLPGLKKRDLALHDLIIDIVALVSKCNKIPLWDEDGDYSSALEKLKANESNNHSVLQNQRESYISGPAAEYLRLIKNRRRQITVDLFREKLNQYNATSGRKHELMWWFRAGISLASTKQTIAGNVYVPAYCPGTPIRPERLYKFVWSIHSNDYLHLNALSKLKADSKFGEFKPVMFSITYPGKKLIPVPASSDRYDFAPMLYGFMSDGVKHLLTRYREYYYKKQFNELSTPSETLLQLYERGQL